jgi:arylsulfatase A-like enzyme
MIRVPVLLLVSAWLLAPSVASGVTVRQVFTKLTSEDYALRFDAALTLVLSKHPGIDALLAKEIADGFFGGSKEAAAAAEFVRLKRSGADLGAESPVKNPGVGFFLISIDTLRSDHLGCYGYARETSPTIDGLATRGALFLNAISPSSWTLPTHMSIFTSLYPSFHKLEHGGRLGSVRLDESEQTLTEILKAAGYTTAGFVAHPFLSGEWGYDRGFDLYRRYSTSADLQANRVVIWLEWHRFHVSRGLASPNFFLFLHFIDPHENYYPPPPHLEKFFPDYQGPLRPTDKFVTLYREKDFETPEDYRYAIALYDGEIDFVDANLEPIFKTLREIGWEESTVVILTSDHGEEFKDHGSMGHKGTLYREQLEVPLIIVYPPRIEAGQRIEAQVSLLDIFPTVLELAGTRTPRKIQGTSLAPYLRMKGSTPPTRTEVRRNIFAELGPLGFEWERDFYRKALRDGKYKLIHSYLADGSITKELYELSSDPEEKVNVYEARKDEKEVRDLEARLEAFVREGIAYNQTFRTKNRIKIDDETQERLRALGYIE